MSHEDMKQLQPELPDDREPTPERQAELHAAYQKNLSSDKRPYEHVKIRTLGELFWVIRERDWANLRVAGTDRGRRVGRLIEKGEQVNLSRANLSSIRLNDTEILRGANLSNAALNWTILEGANLSRANLSDASLIRANLNGSNLSNANLSGAVLLNGAKLSRANLEKANLKETVLGGADLSNAKLRGADLSGASLYGANLRGASLVAANLSNTNLIEADLRGADLRYARMDDATQLVGILLDSQTCLANIAWNGVQLMQVAWEQVSILGDEYKAKHPRSPVELVEVFENGEIVEKERPKSKVERLTERLRAYESAVRANRQVATVLQNQGLNEQADHFAYRAQKLRRVVLRREAFLWKEGRQVWLWQRVRKLVAYVGSLFLDLIVGYGYRPGRTLFWYLLIISVFAWAYYQTWAYYHLEHITKHSLSWVGAVIFSITAFHGRGFFLGGDLGYDSLITILGAVEAVIGLLVELSFITTFTGRFFRR